MRNISIILLFSMLLVCPESVVAQKHFNNWYFGDKAGITFNTQDGEPIPLMNGSLTTIEGCSSISDWDGKLLFYTDGVTVWNKEHQMMVNGDSLYGHYSSTQSAIIVPKPESENLFFIFTSHDPYFSNIGINYSIVDISKNNGLGEVIEKNIQILPTKTEKLSAVMHANNKDIWVVSQDTYSKNFCSFLVTEGGVSHEPVMSPCSISQDHNQGMIKFSPNTKFLALAPMSNIAFFILYDFDNSNGKITNERIFSYGNNSSYSIEFSNNSKFLYLSWFKFDNNALIIQVDISSGDISTITNSIEFIYNNSVDKLGSLQAGPNNKIYFNHHFKDMLGVINNPNEKYPDCDVRFNALSLAKRYSKLGMPSVVQGYNRNQIRICQGESFSLISGYTNSINIEWKGPLEFTSKDINPTISDAIPEMSGYYYYTIFKNSVMIDLDSIQVVVKPLEKILFADKTEILVNAKSYKLKAVENPEKTKIKWYGIDSDENEIAITRGGRYSVVADNESGCRDSASIFIFFDTRYCAGDDISIVPFHDESIIPIMKTEYLWSGPNGFSSTNRYPVLKNANESMTGDYFVRIISYLSYDGLEGERDTIYLKVPIYVYGDLGLELSAGKLRLCISDSTDIFPNNSFSEYLWSTGETTPSITVKDAGNYKLIVKNEFGCADTSEIEIFKYDANIEFDKEKLTFDDLCVGETQTKNIEIRIKTETEFKITDVSISSNSFEIINKNALLKSYKNGEIVNIEIKFKPQDAGKFDDKLVIYSSEPCENVQTIPISASSKQVLEFSFGEHYSEAGQLIEIPLFGQIKCPAPQNLTTDYEIEIAFDKEYFAAESVKYGQVISNEIIGIEKIIKVKADGSFNQSKSEINVIYGKALLGRSESSQIRINDVALSKDRYFPEHLNGSLTVDGCVNDITTIQMFTPTKMTISPNPTDGELKVSIGTQEEGSFRLVIFDVHGREVYRTEFTKSDKTFEQKDYNINTQNLGNGIYTIHLTAPWTLLREQVVVVR